MAWESSDLPHWLALASRCTLRKSKLVKLGHGSDVHVAVADYTLDKGDTHIRHTTRPAVALEGKGFAQLPQSLGLATQSLHVPVLLSAV